MRDDVVYLKDILDQIDVLLREAKTITYEEFTSRLFYRNGMIFSLIIIGEAAKHLSDDFHAKYPDMPISTLAKTRDKLVHGYQGTDFDMVWDIIQNDIPELNTIVRKILDELQ